VKSGKRTIVRWYALLQSGMYDETDELALTPGIIFRF